MAIVNGNSSWVHRYTGTTAHRYTGTLVHGHIASPLHQCTSTQVHRHTGTQRHRYANTMVHKYSGNPIHWYTGTAAYRYTGTPVRGHSVCASCTSKCQMEISRVCVFLMLSKTLCIWHKLCTDCADCWLTSFLFWLGENVCSPLGELWSIPPPHCRKLPRAALFSALLTMPTPPGLSYIEVLIQWNTI